MQRQHPCVWTPIDDALFQYRTVFISGTVDEEQAELVNKSLLALDHTDSTRPIVIWLDSHGGSVYAGMAMYNTIRFVKSPVVCVVAGVALSMGVDIVLAAEKERRLALPHARFMMHQPLLPGYSGQASDMAIMAAEMLKLKERQLRLFAERTGGDEDKFRALQERDCWLDAEAAVELGLVSKIISNRSQLDGLLRQDS
jgi:ATP-dependent Clp protease protease subunit